MAKPWSQIFAWFNGKKETNYGFRNYCYRLVSKKVDDKCLCTLGLSTYSKRSIGSWICSYFIVQILFFFAIEPAEITSPQAAEHNSKRPMLVPNENKEIKEEMEKRRRIGSKPPSCDKKCYGCEPCEAIQVPTISSIPHLSPHYANYQPEGWRCHCAP